MLRIDTLQPWTGMPTNQQIETMYPFSGISGPTDSGAGIATVDLLDDRAAISDLYPAAGWPESFGTIREKVSALLNIRGNGTGDMVETTGINVIARNVADPFNDVISNITGSITKGQVGPDGSFELHGLTPGAQYVLYVDNLMSGAYTVPRALSLPGPEEYYNGAQESGDRTTDDRSAWTTITATPATPVSANVTFNRVKGAPNMRWLPSGYLASDMTPDGSKVVGVAGEQYFVLDMNTGTTQLIGGFAPPGGSPSISDDGTRIAGNYRDPATDTVYWGLYENGTWTALPLRPEAVTPCMFGSSKLWEAVFGISGDGRTVLGGTYANGCGNSSYRATKWTAKGGSVALPKSPDSPTRASRANKANYDGSAIVGYDDASHGYRRGAYWLNGEQHLIGSANVANDPTNFVGEALDITPDGSIIIGLQAGIDGSTVRSRRRSRLALLRAYRRAATPERQYQRSQGRRLRHGRYRQRHPWLERLAVRPTGDHLDAGSRLDCDEELPERPGHLVRRHRHRERQRQRRQRAMLRRLLDPGRQPKLGHRCSQGGALPQAPGTAGAAEYHQRGLPHWSRGSPGPRRHRRRLPTRRTLSQHRSRLSSVLLCARAETPGRSSHARGQRQCGVGRRSAAAPGQARGAGQVPEEDRDRANQVMSL